MKNLVNQEPKFNCCARFFDETPLWSAPFGFKLLEHVNYKRGIMALDVGCGTGFPLIELAMRLGKNSKVYGIDPWREALAVAKDKIEAYEVNNVEVIEGIAEAMPFESGVFDLITSNNGLNNTGDYRKAVAECARVIKPGGQFLQTMNLDKTMFEFYDVFESVLREQEMNEEIARLHDHIKRKRPPLDEVLSVMRRNNFDIKDIEYDQFRYRFVDGTAFLNHHFIRLAFLSSWLEIPPKDKVDSIFLSIESRLNDFAEKHGELKLSVPFVVINAIGS